MEPVKLKVKNKPLIFTDDSMHFAGRQFFYREMSNIAHREGSEPTFVFDYNGKRLLLHYEPKDKDVLTKIFANVIVPKSSSKPLVKSRPVPIDAAECSSKRKGKGKWVAAIVVIIMIVSVIGIIGGSGDDTTTGDKNTAQVTETTTIATEEATQETAEPETTIEEEPSPLEEDTVYISETGSKYHSDSSCSNMKSPSKVTLSQAEGMGLEPCGRCY